MGFGHLYHIRQRHEFLQNLWLFLGGLNDCLPLVGGIRGRRENRLRSGKSHPFTTARGHRRRLLDGNSGRSALTATAFAAAAQDRQIYDSLSVAELDRSVKSTRRW